MIITNIIISTAKAVGVSSQLLLAICTTESNLRNTISPYDGGSPSYGICQIKYETAKMLGFRGYPSMLMQPKQNAYWAAQYLKYQLKRYNGDWCKSIAAYNSGTFNEHRKFRGYPRNIKYVQNVSRYLPSHIQDDADCGVQ